MSFNWFHLVLIYIALNSASKLLQKYSVLDEEVDPTAFSSFFLLVVSLLTIPFLYFEEIQYPTEIKIWLVVLLSSIFYTVCMILFFKSLKNIEVSQVETIATTRTIWLMLLGVIFFKENLYLSQFMGIFFIFLGLIVIYWIRGKEYHFTKYHYYTLLYAILISCAYALDKYLLNYFSVAFFQVVIYIIPALMTIVFIPNTYEKMKCLVKPQRNNYIILLCCFFQMLSTLALYAAYKIGELSLVGPLAQTSTILTIVVGMIVLKERWNLKRKIIGIILTLLGIAFIRFITF
ncbi:MAG: hypothetical protein APF76_01105 [Desulfitibacter sp. BRH_c19]|nr:MAG: hypothetical protein APF76_01105 [Desulfitibacter sp. BRH_c19]